jgi:hypothetical protein
MRECSFAINHKRSQLSRVITHHCEEISRPLAGRDWSTPMIYPHEHLGRR